MANSKISALTALTGASVDAANDVLPIIDVSAGTSGSKKITAAQLLIGIGGASLVANTFTRLQTITQGTANEGILASTGYSLTGSSTVSMVNLAGTWNTSGVATAFKLNITDTASDAASLFSDFQIAGTSMLKVQKDGKIIIAGGAVFRSLAIGSGATNFDLLNAHVGLAAIFGGFNGNSALGIGSAGNSFAGCFVPLANVFGWYDFGNTTPDVTLSRVGANILGINSGTQLQLGVTATTGLVAGALAALTTSSITLRDSTGTVYRVPCITP